MQHTFETPDRVELYVEMGSGDLRTSTAATDQTTVAITGPRAEEFTVEQRDHQIVVLGPKGRHSFFGGDNHVVAVSLPTESDVTTRLGSADAELTGRYGVLRLKTGSGDIRVDEAEGPALVESGSGDVEVGSVGEIRVKSGSGDVEVGESGRVGVSTGSGDVTIGRAHEAATLKTGSGDLEVKHADDDVTLTSASGDLRIGNVRRGKVTAKNVSGDVAIGVPAGTPVWTDITATTGGVVNRLEPTGEPQPGQEHVEIRATTVSGDIILERA